jgi:DNA-binding XRE family transcriptional regulator
MIDRCVECGGRDLKRGKYEVSRVVAGRTYTARLPGEKCATCGRTYVHGPSLLKFELAIAVHLGEHGPISGEALTWIRIAVGLAGRELARLLGVRPETISRWENGKGDIDRKAWALVATLAAEKYTGERSTRDRLEALARPLAAARGRVALRVADAA